MDKLSNCPFLFFFFDELSWIFYPASLKPYGHTFSYVREAVKNYLADFFSVRGGGYPPNSASWHDDDGDDDEDNKNNE